MPQATARIRPPFRGLVTNKDASLLADNEAADCKNIVLTENGIECRRTARGIGTVGFYTGGTVTAGFTDAFTSGDSATVTGWNELETNGAWAIASNAVTWTPSGGTSIGFLTKTGYMRSGYLTATVSCPSGTATGAGLCLRKNGNGNTACYVALIPNQATGATEFTTQPIYYPSILYYNGTTYTLLANYYSNSTVSTYTLDTTPKKFRFVALGNFLALYYYSGSAWECLCSCVDYTINGTTDYDDVALHGRESILKFDDVFHGVADHVTGFKTFLLNNGAKFNLLKAGDEVQNLGTDSLGTVVTMNGDVPFEGSVPSWAQFGNRIYMADGSAAPKITDGTNVYNLTIAAPSGAVTLADGGGSNNTGVYDYKYTYYSSTWGIESAASPVSATITLDTSEVDISGMSVSADSRVDKHRIYRRKLSLDDVQLETDWSLVAEIAEATTYTDLILDNDVDHNHKCPSSTAPTYMDFTAIAFFNKRMWYAGSSNGRSRVYFSNTDQPGAIDAADYLVVGGDDGDTNPVVAIVEAYGSLVAMKRKGVYQITGTSKETYFVSSVSASAGCTSVGSVQKIEDALYWAGYDAIYRWDGTGLPVQLSECIEPTYRARIAAADVLMTSVDDKKMGMVYWTYLETDAVAPRKMLVFFYRQSMKLGLPCWGLFDFTTATEQYGVSAVGSLTAGKTGEEQIWWAFQNYPTISFYTGGWRIGIYRHDNNDLIEFNTAGDLSEPITWSWTTGKMDGGAIEKVKHWSKLFVDVKRQGGATNTLTITPYYDNGTASTAITGDMNADSIIDGPIVPNSRQLQLKFSSSSGLPANIFSWALSGFAEAKAGT